MILLKTLSVLLIITVATSRTIILTQQFFTQTFTDNDFSSWLIGGAIVPPNFKFTTCSGSQLFGGYNVLIGDASNPSFITKTWSGLVSHYSLRIRVKIYKIDSWVSETLFIMADGATTQLYTWSHSNGGTSDICGNPTPVVDSINTNYNEVITVLDVAVSHSSPTLNLTFISNLNSPSGSWGIRELNLTIEACDQSCLTCITSSYCSTCDTASGLTLIGAFCVCTAAGTITQKLTQFTCTAMPCVQCVPGCTNGYYYSIITTDCQPCSQACTTCATSTNSPSCGACSPGYFRTSVANACSTCSFGCATCTGLTSTSCTSCLYSYFLNVNQCVSQCPLGKYSEQSSRKCFACTSPCLSCNGMSNSYCLSCISGYNLLGSVCYFICPTPYYSWNGKCLSQCPMYTYPETANNSCASCVSLCQECTNGTTCFICNNAFMLNGLCYSPCPTSYYGSNATGLCITCNLNCQTCSGPSTDNCLSCFIPAILINSQCYTTCPNNTYSALCLFCNTNCLTCSGASASNCLSCYSPQFFHLNYSTCLSTCNEGELVDNFNSTYKYVIYVVSCGKCLDGWVAQFLICVRCNPSCLTCEGTTFLDCVSCLSGISQLSWNTCTLLQNPKIIYAPDMVSSFSLGNAILTLMVLHLTVCVLLQIIFQYKTNLLPTIELIQMLSYTYYFSFQMSQSTQTTLLMLYYTNFTSINKILPILSNSNIPAKFILNHKSGYYIADMFFGLIIFISIGILFAVIKVFSNKYQLLNKLYKKINPYLLSYIFRLIFLEIMLNMMLFLSNFDVSNGAGIASIAFVVVSIVAILGSFCWKIKTQEDSSQAALFYYNEIGQNPNHKDKVYEATQKQETEAKITIQDKIREGDIFPSIICYISKFPLPATIIFFGSNFTTQTICLLVYYIFYLLINLFIPYRRRIYRFTIIFCCSILILNSIMCILVANKMANSIAIEAVCLISLLVLFCSTLMQIMVNYAYFGKFFCYLKNIISIQIKSQDKDSQLNHTQQINASDANISDNITENQEKISNIHLNQPTHQSQQQKQDGKTKTYPEIEQKSQEPLNFANISAIPKKQNIFDENEEVSSHNAEIQLDLDL